MKYICTLICLFTIGCVTTPDTQSISPEFIEEQVVSLLKLGKQDEAEDYLDKHIVGYTRNQRLMFIQASLIRSRFLIDQSYIAFGAVTDGPDDTVEGQCAYLMRLIDNRIDVRENMQLLLDLVNDNPSRVFVRWMLAVQCRNYNYNELGAEQYQKLTESWKPGPVLFHQTYANILDGLNRFEMSLKHRRIAVSMEPKGWSYQGLGFTLSYLKRWGEADQAFEEGLNLAKEARLWRSWAWSLFARGSYDSAIEKCEKAINLDRYNWRSLSIWADCLEKQGKLVESLGKNIESQRINPQNDYVNEKIEALKKELDKNKFSA